MVLAITNSARHEVHGPRSQVQSLPSMVQGLTSQVHGLTPAPLFSLSAFSVSAFPSHEHPHL